MEVKSSSDMDSQEQGPPLRTELSAANTSPVRNISSASVASGGKTVKRVTAPRAKRAKKNQIPDQVLHNASLNEAISILPANYNFEIHKTVWRVLSDDSIQRVSLQVSECVNSE